MRMSKLHLVKLLFFQRTLYDIDKRYYTMIKKTINYNVSMPF